MGGNSRLKREGGPKERLRGKLASFIVHHVFLLYFYLVV